MAIKFCGITLPHASWLSLNRLSDPTVGNSSDGYLLSALTSGFHANFDGSSFEYATINTVTAGGAGEVSIPGMTATGSVIVSLLEDPGTGLTYSHSVCAADKITIYVKDTDSAAAPGGAAAAIANDISVSIKVLALSSTIDATNMTLFPVKGMVSTSGSKVCGGTNQGLVVHAQINGTSTLYAATAGFSGSKLNLNFADTNNKASVLACSQNDNYSIPAATNFIYSFDVDNWDNRNTVAANGLIQVGVMAQGHASFQSDITAGPQVASGSAIYVQFAANTMKLVFNTTSSAIVAIPTTLTKFSVRVEYRAGKAAFLYLNNKPVATVTLTTAVTAMQPFARAGHTASYTAATDAPITFGLDALSICIDKA